MLVLNMTCRWNNLAWNAKDRAPLSSALALTWLDSAYRHRSIFLAISSSLHIKKCLQISFRTLRISKTSHQLRTGARFQQEWQKVPTFLSSAQVATCNPLTPPSIILSEYWYLFSGGSILNELLQHKKNNYTISALVRNQEQFKTLLEIGVTPLKFESLDDFKTIKSVAKDHDS